MLQRTGPAGLVSGTRAQLRAICEKSTLPDIGPQKGVEELGALTGVRRYEGTRLQALTTACAPCTPRPRPARLQPAAQSHPSHPTSAKEKAGRPRQASALLVFLGSWLPQEGVAALGCQAAWAGRGDGRRATSPFCYVGAPSTGPMAQVAREGCHCRTTMFGFLGTCHKRGTGRAASPHRPNKPRQ